MNTYCNPLDLGYRYQQMREGAPVSFREGADPTLILFRDVYYLFVSMSAGFWYSRDLLNWDFHPNSQLLIYDYAPDVRQIGDYLYFCASRRGRNCPILRTRDPLSDDFTQVSAPFDFWDPDLFQDDDGRVYLYWGCTNTDPIFGVEMDRETMLPIGEPKPLIFENVAALGYERPGDNGIVEDPEDSVVYRALKAYADPVTGRLNLPDAMVARTGGFTKESLEAMFYAIGKPYIEGAFMTKVNGIYYLQYACPGTQYNTYSDGVYTSASPLGPFTRQAHNPFSSKPGGFAAGAGHGSTVSDRFGNLWHTATMRISVNHAMERRIGLFPAGVDADGVLFCNQNFADYPTRIPQGKFDPWDVKPEWMLLNYRSPVTASSTGEGSAPELAVNEDIRTWWSAASPEPGQWLCCDLETEKDVRAVQVNLADEGLCMTYPDEEYGSIRKDRRIELAPQISSYTLEASRDGETWTVLAEVDRECSNGYFEFPEGIRARYLRVTGGTLPFGQVLRISGLRIFGNGSGTAPAQADPRGERNGDLDCTIRWEPIPGADGCNVRYGTAPDKLYSAWMVYGENSLRISTLTKDQDYWYRVDSFNENGITPGRVMKL